MTTKVATAPIQQQQRQQQPQGNSRFAPHNQLNASLPPAVCAVPSQPRPWWQLKQRLMEASGCLGRNFDETSNERRLRCASSTCSLPILQLVSLFFFFLCSCCSLLQLPHMPHSPQHSILCPKSVACCCCCSLNLRSLCKMKCPMRTAMHLVANSVGYALQTHKITVIVVVSARAVAALHTVQLAGPPVFLFIRAAATGEALESELKLGFFTCCQSRFVYPVIRRSI